MWWFLWLRLLCCTVRGSKVAVTLVNKDPEPGTKFWQSQKFKKTIPPWDCFYNLLLLTNQSEYGIKWGTDQATQDFVYNIYVAAQMDHTLKMFYCCILNCIIAHSSVCVIIPSTYSKANVAQCVCIKLPRSL